VGREGYFIFSEKLQYICSRIQFHFEKKARDFRFGRSAFPAIISFKQNTHSFIGVGRKFIFSPAGFQSISATGESHGRNIVYLGMNLVFFAKLIAHVISLKIFHIDATVQAAPSHSSVLAKKPLAHDGRQNDSYGRVTVQK